ncbi:hypothetical protein TraAM80_08714 [Trypanosoma rangeli]|uniref:Ubiquitin-like domain-containing protein n=1 Tax=Trypanosoma rangeli TaxID=5698 RepID=A0A3R7N8K1_TRYRA|nr:uncharacterized protein TraAM80_08714 [Trypanosoma rangeli]RNE98517.1 hypothetical protein TraAM80_08714 [Trypanosoma rangeli]|eukprot:RNE98517.1 hypothetical protein TraAM80_08714 [Trypanosoma rangeli]
MSERIPSRSSERGGPAVTALYASGVEDDVGSGSRTHQPYARFYCNNGSNGNQYHYPSEKNGGCMVSSPLQVHTHNTHDDGEEDLGFSALNVQARYRLQSLSHSNRACDPHLSTSPPYAWSSNSSFHGDASQSRFAARPLSSAPIPVEKKSDFMDSFGSRGVSTFSGSYAPSGFAMPPALAGSASPPTNSTSLRSPHHNQRATPRSLGSPNSAQHGVDFASPILFSVSSPVHNELSPIQNLSIPVNGGAGMRGGHGIIVEQQPQGRQGRLGTGVSDGNSTISGSSTSTVRDDLALCPKDDLCTQINDRKHQRKYAHTCRLFPCYHGHVARHGKLFRHAPGQIAQGDALTAVKGTPKTFPAEALVSVNFSSISPQANNAYRIIVSHGDQSYEIFGDWQNVRVHTFKRYLHQVYKIPPTSQVLVRVDGGLLLDDDLEPVRRYGVMPGTVIALKRKGDEDTPRVPPDEL